MKALFIWNKESKFFIEQKINKQFSEGVNFITSQKEFEEFLPIEREDFTKDEKKAFTEKDNVFKSYTKIYILAELGWNNTNLFEGYEVGFTIIERWGQDKAPHIEFFSIGDQNIVFDNVRDKYKYIVKAFTFTDILSIGEGYKFDTENINAYKWEYFKYLILTNYGVLDNFLHRLESIKPSNKNFKESLDDFAKELRSYKEFAGVELMQALENVIYTQGFVSKIKNLIEIRIFEITGEKSKRISIPKSIKVLIVDDNEDDLNLIKNSLSRYEIQIACTKYGKEAYHKILNDECDLVISDLELLDENGFYQDIQGVELVDIVKKSDDKVIGIITGLGRKGISSLLGVEQKKILPKKHLHRFDIDEELDNLLEILIKSYAKKEQALEIELGPKKGIFNKPGFKNTLAKAFAIKEYEESVWDEAFSIANKFIDKTLSSKDWNKELIRVGNIKNADFNKFIEKSLTTLLAHRLIIIYLAHRNGGILNRNQEEYHEVLLKNDITIGKNHINTICLKYETKKAGKVWKIEYINLFPQEIKFINNLQKEYKQEFAKILISENAPLTYSWIKNHFVLNQNSPLDTEIKDDIEDWSYEDLEIFLNHIINDFINEEKESMLFDTWNNAFDYLTISIEREIYPILPNLKSKIQKVGDLLIDLN